MCQDIHFSSSSMEHVTFLLHDVSQFLITDVDYSASSPP
jgi:hypothetical protein